MKQPEVPQAASMSFFHALELALKKMGAFDGLDNRRLAILMRDADVRRDEGTPSWWPVGDVMQIAARPEPFISAARAATD